MAWTDLARDILEEFSDVRFEHSKAQAETSSRGHFWSWRRTKKTSGRGALAAKVRAAGLAYPTVATRVRQGWDERLALSAPPCRSGRRPDPRSLSARARKAGLLVWTVWYRIRILGWTEERALSTPVTTARRAA
jgi:hypothetical protein